MTGAGWPLVYEPGGSLTRPWDSDSPLDALRNLAREFASSSQPLWCPASLRSGESGKAQVFRVRPGQSMHVVGTSRLAGELRSLLSDGAEPGWDLHPVPGSRTPLRVLAGPLRRMSGNSRFFNLLDRSGFAYVEEVAATPDECLTDLKNGGPGLVAAVRQVLTETAPDLASPFPGAAHDGQEKAGTGQLSLRPATLQAFRVMAAWVISEREAGTIGDLIATVGIARELPPDVAAAWNHLRQLELRHVVGSVAGSLSSCAGGYPAHWHWVSSIRSSLAEMSHLAGHRGVPADDREARCKTAPPLTSLHRNRSKYS